MTYNTLPWTLTKQYAFGLSTIKTISYIDKIYRYIRVEFYFTPTAANACPPQQP